jgi:hypothetical protein
MRSQAFESMEVVMVSTGKIEIKLNVDKQEKEKAIPVTEFTLTTSCQSDMILPAMMLRSWSRPNERGNLDTLFPSLVPHCLVCLLIPRTQNHSACQRHVFLLTTVPFLQCTRRKTVAS